ncbi:MAG: ABC transporter ATP-binding protein [Gemmatimonadetes bacterium]|nr:ABC transporter ATP-binding protein [Gemmatimonadota bacterium]
MIPLEVRGLEKSFGRVRALQGVSFALEPGEVFGYLGPNGAGKTTTLRIILGLVHAGAGQVSIFGRSPALPASRRDIGFIPGDLRLHGELTGHATLDFFARFHPDRPPRLRGVLQEALALDQGTLRRRVKFLSHGTRQKLGLLIAMQHDPPLLLLDEPSNGLDPLVQKSFRELIRDFAARGASVLFSSHVLSEAEDVCRRVAILRAGSLVALETIDNLRARVVRCLSARLQDEVPAGLDALPGVVRCEASGRELKLWLRGDLNPVLRALAAAGVTAMVFPEPELEDIFLGYYAGEAPAHG